jgi:predicted dehydrogenase
MKNVNILLIGVGPHAQRVYLPYLKDNKFCNLVACLELHSQKDRVKNLLQNFAISVPCYFTKNYSISDKLNTKELNNLNKIVQEHKVEAVIISTEPLAHFKYAEWALKKDLHVLMDKPITTEVNVSTNVSKAKKLFRDYKTLAEMYSRKNKKKNLVFMVQAQRRYHIGFQVARRKIIEMAKLSYCPITFIQTFHSDGQWTFPHEFITQTYHPYHQGYGKMSHSGYHSLDIALWLALASLRADKTWNHFKLYAQPTRPKDILAQFSTDDYLKFFFEPPKIKWWNSHLEKKASKITGEVDMSSNISLMKDKKIITNICCNTLHNSFSRRGWFDSTLRDLYKGNGRVRQESYIIEQGPFQSIIINSFQSQEIQKRDKNPYSVGGEYHFDIHIFRNTSMFPELLTYEFLNMCSLKPVKDYGYSRGHQEDARRNCILDFYQSIVNKVPPEKQISNIMYHNLTTQIFSAIYTSAAKQSTV